MSDRKSPPSPYLGGSNPLGDFLSDDPRDLDALQPHLPGRAGEPSRPRLSDNRTVIPGSND